MLQKKTDEEIRKEERQGRLNDYEIFMAQTLAIGHDKRGNTLYVRNDDGEELLFPPEGEETELYELGAPNGPVRRVLRPTKVVDDDCPVVTSEFLTWKKAAVLGW